MTRRPQPHSTGEESQRALDRMKATLQGHVHRVQSLGNARSHEALQSTVSLPIEANGGSSPLPGSLSIHAEAESRETSVREALSQPLGTSARQT